MNLRALVPTSIVNDIKLRRIRRAHPEAGYIQSIAVSAHARLGRQVGLAVDVVVGDDVQIGDFTYVNRGAIVVSASVGRFCSIGYYSQIGVEDHPIDGLSTSPLLYGPANVVGATTHSSESNGPAVLGSDVWIGGNAIVRQGVTIGHGAVVGANSVVIRDVPPYAVVVGAPARVVRFRFSDEVIAALLELEWWNTPEGRLHELGPVADAGSSWTVAQLTTALRLQGARPPKRE